MLRAGARLMLVAVPLYLMGPQSLASSDAIRGTDLERMVAHDVSPQTILRLPDATVLDTSRSFRNVLVLRATPQGPRFFCVASKKAAEAVFTAPHGIPLPATRKVK